MAGPLDKVKSQVDWQLKTLRTDYIDYGFIHCLDEEKDWISYQKNGVLQFLLDMKDKGVVRHIGLSTHTPSLARQVLDSGLVDQLMFSINAGYDYQRGDYANGSANERMELYRYCEKEGVGISVMKPFSGGQLLEGRTSPFGMALSLFCHWLFYAAGCSRSLCVLQPLSAMPYRIECGVDK